MHRQLVVLALVRRRPTGSLLPGARYCLTPEAVTLARLLVGAKSGSPVESAAVAAPACVKDDFRNSRRPGSSTTATRPPFRPNSRARVGLGEHYCFPPRCSAWGIVLDR
jgi:hypothetical protein